MGRKRREVEERSGPRGAPRWVVTFTDMVSLLVTFFIVLLTFSSSESYEALRLDFLLEGNRGLLEHTGSLLAELGEEDLVAASSVERGAHAPHARPADQLPESLEEMGQALTEDHRELDLNQVGDGLVIEFGAEESFAPGSIAVSESLGRSLGEIARVLQHYPHVVVVEGFTDGAFRASPDYPTADALSIARAKSAARYMLRNSELTPELVQISGHGDRAPRADDVSPSGRRLNRRVRIRVLSISKLRAAHLEAKEASEG